MLVLITAINLWPWFLKYFLIKKKKNQRLQNTKSIIKISKTAVRFSFNERRNVAKHTSQTGLTLTNTNYGVCKMFYLMRSKYILLGTKKIIILA